MMDVPGFIERNIKLIGNPIRLYEYQKNILTDMADFRIINKARQIGITQTISWEALINALAKPKELIGIISVSERMAKDVLSYIEDAYYSLPPELQLKLTVDTKQEKCFNNGSRILSLPQNPRTVRGKPYTHIYFDEVAHYLQDREIMDAALPGLSRGGRATWISTPLGKRGEFYRIWTEAEDTGMTKYELPYTVCPDMVARINLLRGKMDEERFQQEYMCRFLDETTSMFPYELIMRCTDESLTGDVIPKTRNPFTIGMDFGKKIDSTVIIGVEHEELIKYVRYIREWKPPTTYTEATNFIIRNYPEWKPTRISVDQNGPGEKPTEDLRVLGSVVRGEMFTKPLKESMISNLKALMLDGRLKFPKNEDLISQLHALQKVITETGAVIYKHPTSGSTQHDDYVWALALAVYDQMGIAEPTKPMPLGGSAFNVNKRPRGSWAFANRVIY